MAVNFDILLCYKLPLSMGISHICSSNHLSVSYQIYTATKKSSISLTVEIRGPDFGFWTFFVLFNISVLMCFDPLKDCVNKANLAKSGCPNFSRKVHADLVQGGNWSSIALWLVLKAKKNRIGFMDGKSLAKMHEHINLNHIDSIFMQNNVFS